MVYIGSSRNIGKRFEQHIGSIKKGKSRIYTALRDYGVDDFDFSVIEECEVKQLLIREEHWVDTYKCCWPSGFNCIPKPTRGYTFEIGEADRCRRISESNTGKKRPPEIGIKIGLAQRGKVISEDQKASLREVNLGKKYSAETKAKHAKRMTENNPFKGKKHDADTRTIIKAKRASQIMSPCSPETKRKISEANKGHVIPEDVRAKQSLAAKARWQRGDGTVLTPEAIAKRWVTRRKNGTDTWIGRPFPEASIPKLSAALKVAWVRRKENGLTGWNSARREKQAKTIQLRHDLRDLDMAIGWILYNLMNPYIPASHQLTFSQ